MADLRSSDWGDGPKTHFGIIFGIVGAALALGFWYFMLRVVNVHGVYLALLAGGIVGVAVRLGGMGRSTLLGCIAGGLAIISIGGGYFMHARFLADQFSREEAETRYKEDFQEAQRLVAMKKRTEVRAYLAEREGVDLKKISKRDVAQWREDELPDIKAFVEAPPEAVKADYAAAIRSGIPTGDVFKVAFDVFSILMMVFGVLVAFSAACSFWSR